MFAFFICILTDGDFKNVILAPSGNRPFQASLLEFVLECFRRGPITKESHLQTSELDVCKAAIAVGNAPSQEQFPIVNPPMTLVVGGFTVRLPLSPM